jgi:AcrR family transcriptional regulator
VRKAGHGRAHVVEDAEVQHDRLPVEPTRQGADGGSIAPGTQHSCAASTGCLGGRQAQTAGRSSDQDGGHAGTIWQSLPLGNVCHTAGVTRPVPLRERKKERTRAAIAQAALELFTTRGFEAVTLAEVAQAADVGQRTLFRYFLDKEELLFGDDAVVQGHLQTALAARPAEEPPASTVLEAVVSLAPLWQDRREEGRTRRAVIEASPALHARQLAKYSGYERVLLDGLVARGLGRPGARLLARTAVACTDEALTRWFSDDDPAQPGLAGRARETFAELSQQLRTTDPAAPDRSGATSS